MRALLVAAGVLAVTVLALAPAAGATNECNGLQTCVPVAGPWVVVPTSGPAARRPQVQYLLACPKGFVIGGIDVEVSDRAIDVAFLGRSGAPINPGITTGRAAVFVAGYVGTGAAAATFRPHLGCVPSSGGGARVPTAARAFPVGTPTTRRVREVDLAPGRSRVVQGCDAGERLVGGSHAVAFYQTTPPTPALVAAVRASSATEGGRVVAIARTTAAVRERRPVIQVDAVCAGGT